MDRLSLLLPSTPRFLPKSHTRAASRSPTRPRIMDDLLSDLSPATTLEAFTSASGTLKASIEAASPAQRAFGIRAVIASKKIQEWVAELSAWSWPMQTSEGFEIPTAKRSKLPSRSLENHETETEQRLRQNDQSVESEEYWGSVPALDVLRYESRIEEISQDMEDLNVEEIKSQVLDTHILLRSRTSWILKRYVEASVSPSYKEMDDFTAVVTATILQALPSLSRLMALMDTWSVRVSVLRQVRPLMALVGDAEVALVSGWTAIQTQQSKPEPDGVPPQIPVISRQDYEIMRDVLQEKVSKLGRRLDLMLDTLEGRDDTLPEAWLDRMESIEQDYGEWVVCGERNVRAGEWNTEISARGHEKLRNSPHSVVNPSPSDIEGGEPVREHSDNIVANSTHLTTSQPVHAFAIEGTLFKHAPPLESVGFDMSTMEALQKYSTVSLFDGPKGGSLFTAALKDATVVEKSIPEPTTSVGLAEHYPLDDNADVLSIKPGSSPSSSQGKIDMPAHREEVITDLYSLSDGVSDSVISKGEQMISTGFPQASVKIWNELILINEDKPESNEAAIRAYVIPVAEEQALVANNLLQDNGKASAPPRPLLLGGRSDIGTDAWLPNPSIHENHHEASHTPPYSSELPRSGYSLTNSLHREMPSEVSCNSSPKNSYDSSHTIQASNSTTTAIRSGSPVIGMLQTPQKQFIGDSRSQDHASEAVRPLPPAGDSNLEQTKAIKHSSKPTHIDLRLLPSISTSAMTVHEPLSPDMNSPSSTKSHNRGPSSVSIISGYATSEPSPVIREAEPTEYFRPVSPPIISKLPDLSSVATPTRALFNSTPVSGKVPETELRRESAGLSQSQLMSLNYSETKNPSKQNVESDSGGTPLRKRPVSNDSVISVMSTLGQARGSQEGSVSSDVSTINARLNSVAATPVRNLSPEIETVPRSWHSQFVSNYDGDSPSLGRIRLPHDSSLNSPKSSPPETPSSECHSPQLHRTPSFDPELLYSDSPSTARESPAPCNVELSSTPALSNPSKSSEDQLQQQISEILDSIPARIRLTSESDTAGTSGIKQIKKRISLNPFSRPLSRAATPSFTLAPVYAKNPRPRPQNGNPEIKLYHLSRSTGEAPIKLFVRLVGENGERVMVRVGGGWADLGEYLKEYASHHSRRSDQPGEVEIQDLPPRVVSTGSMASTSTLRNGTWSTSGASSPISRPSSRPGSALARPLSSLAIRKTRKSVGEEAREKTYRSPSTPISPSFHGSPFAPRQNETPPSGASAHSASQIPWREEKSSLGLAGPRSRKGEISAENAAWVESMKEKVRIASAEKEKKEKAMFADMGQAGVTRRLFKKSG